MPETPLGRHATRLMAIALAIAIAIQVILQVGYAAPDSSEFADSVALVVA